MKYQIIDDFIIFELKSMKRIVKVHEIQLLNYFIAKRITVGLIINFGYRKVKIKKK